NYGATLALNDFGTKGSTLGFVFGMEPKLTGTSNQNVANLISGGSLPVGARRDQDTGFHIEGFYKFNVSRNIAITPGVIWLTAPGHNNNNDDIVIGTVRTTFTF
ncbi:MAG: carbohydrate porin, partial [Coleofasciculaceae cyanobacterium]